jgi:shikimate kinase
MQNIQNKWTPNFIFLIGPSGSGKTVVCSKLAELMQWPSFDTDILIELQENKKISDIFDAKGESYFRHLELNVINNVLSKSKQGVVATGGGLPTIYNMMDMLSQAGITVYLKASLDELWNRLTVDRSELDKRPLLRKKGRIALEKMIHDRDSVYSTATITLLTDEMSVDEIAKRTLEIITPKLMTNGYY